MRECNRASRYEREGELGDPAHGENAAENQVEHRRLCGPICRARSLPGRDRLSATTHTEPMVSAAKPRRELTCRF